MKLASHRKTLEKKMKKSDLNEKSTNFINKIYYEYKTNYDFYHRSDSMIYKLILKELYFVRIRLC